MKTTNIIIRVSDLEKEKIKEQAEKNQMSMSEYMLYLFRKEPKIQNLNTKFQYLCSKKQEFCYTQSLRIYAQSIRILYAEYTH